MNPIVHSSYLANIKYAQEVYYIMNEWRNGP